MKLQALGPDLAVPTLCGNQPIDGRSLCVCLCCVYCSAFQINQSFKINKSMLMACLVPGKWASLGYSLLQPPHVLLAIWLFLMAEGLPTLLWPQNWLLSYSGPPTSSNVAWGPEVAAAPRSTSPHSLLSSPSRSSRYNQNHWQDIPSGKNTLGHPWFTAHYAAGERKACNGKQSLPTSLGLCSTNTGREILTLNLGHTNVRRI